MSGSGDRTTRIWDWIDAKCLHTLRINEVDQSDPGVTSIAVSPDSRLVAAGSLDKMVRIWDAVNGTLLERLEGHKDSVYSVAFMPDGKTLVSGSLDKTLRMWQLGDRTKNPCIQVFSGHKDFVLSVATTPDDRWIVSGSKDRSVQFWDPRTGQTQFMLQGHKNSGTCTCGVTVDVCIDSDDSDIGCHESRKKTIVCYWIWRQQSKDLELRASCTILISTPTHPPTRPMK